MSWWFCVCVCDSAPETASGSILGCASVYPCHGSMDSLSKNSQEKGRVWWGVCEGHLTIFSVACTGKKSPGVCSYCKNSFPNPLGTSFYLLPRPEKGAPSLPVSWLPSCPSHSLMQPSSSGYLPPPPPQACSYHVCCCCCPFRCLFLDYRGEFWRNAKVVKKSARTQETHRQDLWSGLE